MSLIDRDALLTEMRVSLNEYNELGKIDMALGYGSAICDVKQAAAVNVRPQWIDVNDRLPTDKDQDCWVMVKGEDSPEIDIWEGHRGETVIGVFGDGRVREYTRSGWYYNDCNEVTHWIPIEQPEPPKEDE